MTPATQLCAARACSLFRSMANGRTTLATAAGAKPSSGFRRAVVAAYSSSSRACTAARPLSTRTPPTMPSTCNTASRRSPTHATVPLCTVRHASTSTSHSSHVSSNNSSTDDNSARSTAVSSTSSSSSSPSSSTSTSTSNYVANTAANPPHTTRPPPLELPERNPDASTFSYLFATGKAYLSFYKTGLRYLVANTKQVRAMDANKDADSEGEGGKTWHATRADLLTRRRWGHDMRRLPLFGLLLLICGEFTPFVVLVFPHVVPYTCRIPKQVLQLRTKVEERRQAAFKEYEVAIEATKMAGSEQPSDTANNLLISRSLGLVAPFWDRIGLLSAAPGIAHRAVERRLAFLTEDDALLREAGGAAALEPEEVFLASADRGLNVVGQDEGRLRKQLVKWLELTRPDADNAGPDGDHDYIHQQMLTLLTQRPEAWPQK
ncbi:hypothetical protein SBRCBS47491_008528 [Sporothrix bragantina]|uniref:Letm1 RBD domain-containing protein n=1 Tax=Sporothrix bragantina TaxID=671064 RepID=A0ABP0CMT2_9PEZI